MDYTAEFENAFPALQTYCRLDDPSAGEKAMLEGMFWAAVSYMAEAGISMPASGTIRRAKYNLCINALVLDAWDQRGAQTTGSSVEDNPAFQRAKNQLKHTEPPRTKPVSMDFDMD